ncbi:MAG: DUF2182 domain-containing protein [Gemmatimonadota bacterium]
MTSITRADRASRRTFVGISMILFAVSCWLTMAWCRSMSAMGGLRMPGGWSLSMIWMRMGDQTWVSATGAFLAMWVVMMVAMMLPSVAPLLWRYRQRMAHAGATHVGLPTAVSALGYLAVWTALGILVFPLGVAVAELEVSLSTLASTVPLVVGVVVLVGGAYQFTASKAGQLACCRLPTGRVRARPAAVGTAWRDGVRLGLECSRSCANWMAILLVLGVMDLGAMVAVTIAICAERLAPARLRVGRATGALAIALGVILIARADSG